MSKCRITVIKRMLNEDLANAYCKRPEICSVFTDNQTFMVDSPQKPLGFCDGAWDCISHYVFAFLHGGGDFYTGWMKDENTMIACCNDGVRPVVFKLERVD
ncbi:TIGR04076 family protein [Vallitalea pronyensis]|uniref:TIGR04076 family protein n=2 Tax=Vallitalea pronyensis TaxID=1348613 RepID=A0A8J8MQR6_9FIRM|nr:TIGR04076 family protein [Vallitalea pronyensis]